MANENLWWGAARIRGELLKLGIAVSTRSIQKYMPKFPLKRQLIVATSLEHESWHKIIMVIGDPGLPGLIF
jgi:hypothetical protein